MREAFLRHLACPACLGQLQLESRDSLNVIQGELRCIQCQRQYAVRSGLPLALLKDKHWTATQREIEGEREFVDEMPVAEHIKRNQFESRRSWDFLRKLKVPDKPLMLDVGGSSGIGAYLFRPFQARVVMIDIVPDLLKIGEACLEGRMEADTAVASMEWLPFSSNAFDVVFCRQTLHHSADPPQAVREMLRVTKRGGLLLVLGEPCASILDRIRSSFKRKNMPLGRAAEILEKLPDKDFCYLWRDFVQVLKPLTEDFQIERAYGAAGAVPTESGIVFDPHARRRGPIGSLLEKVLPFGLGFGGDVNIRAVKTTPVERLSHPPEFEPVRPEEIEIHTPNPDECANYRSLFSQFFEIGEMVE